MKLNPDCVRDVLLYLENHLEYVEDDKISVRIDAVSWKKLQQDEELTSKYSVDEIRYSVRKLNESKYIIAYVKMGVQQSWIECTITDITWEGYEFLDTIRSKTIWQATKENAIKLGGMSLKNLATFSTSIAEAVVTNPDLISSIVKQFLNN